MTPEEKAIKILERSIKGWRRQIDVLQAGLGVARTLNNADKRTNRISAIRSDIDDTRRKIDDANDAIARLKGSKA